MLYNSIAILCLLFIGCCGEPAESVDNNGGLIDIPNESDVVTATLGDVTSEDPITTVAGEPNNGMAETSPSSNSNEINEESSSTESVENASQKQADALKQEELRLQQKNSKLKIAASIAGASVLLIILVMVVIYLKCMR